MGSREGAPAFDAPLVQVQRLAFPLGQRTLHVVGGSLAEPLLATRSGTDVRVVWTEDADTVPEGAPAFSVPFLAQENGQVVQTQSMIYAEVIASPATDASGRGDRWVVGALAASLLLVMLSARFVANWISRPLVDLVDDVSRFDLRRQLVRSEGAETLAQRPDEIGDLSRAFLRMRDRLHATTEDLREADRRLALGDIARQINHDLKNGFMPLRNVFQHLAHLETSDPAEFVQVFRERRRTLEASLEYLEELSTNYGKLSLPDRREIFDLHPVLEEVSEGMSTRRVIVEARLDARDPRLRADPVAVRRIVENLVRNARDSYGDGSGRVAIATADARGGNVEVSVIDQGCGMTPEERDHMFEHFYTTKSAGTGLGLGIVQRLVGDLDGSIEVQTAPGDGTTVKITLPALGGDSDES